MSSSYAYLVDLLPEGYPALEPPTFLPFLPGTPEFPPPVLIGGSFAPPTSLHYLHRQFAVNAQLGGAGYHPVRG
jgi:hypothetical protein